MQITEEEMETFKHLYSEAHAWLTQRSQNKIIAALKEENEQLKAKAREKGPVSSGTK